MSIAEFSLWLAKIHGIYPRFEVASNKTMIDAWYNRIGQQISVEQADTILEKWIQSEKGEYAPSLVNLVKLVEGSRNKRDVFYDTSVHIFHLTKRGVIEDQNGYEYGDPEEPNATYHYDADGNIVNEKGQYIAWANRR